MKQLISFHRSPSWIAAEFAGQWATEGRNTEYTDEEKRRFREDPEYFLEYRRNVEHSMNARFPSFFKHSGAQKLGVENISKSMKARLGNDPELSAKLIPKFELGCRRVTPGHGYLEALTADNVAVETAGISRVTGSGIETVDGKFYHVDVIITATGYVTSFVPRFPIVGLGGVNLQDVWREKGARGYLSVTAPSMPNYFSKSRVIKHTATSTNGLSIATTGPNSPISNGSLIPGIESQIDFAFAFVRKLQTEDLRYVVVTQQATDEFNEWKDEFMQGMTWTGSCTSW